MSPASTAAIRRPASISPNVIGADRAVPKEGLSPVQVLARGTLRSMGLRLLAVAALLALAVTAAPATAKPRAAKRLKAFGSCAALVGYASRHTPSAPVRRDLPQQRVNAPAAEGAPEDTSQTNVHEAGVDEP